MPGTPRASASRINKTVTDSHSTRRARRRCGYLLGPRPGALVPRPVEIETYYRDVLEAIECPVAISNNSALAGYAFSTQLIETLIADYSHITEVLIADNVGPLINQVQQLSTRFGDTITIRVGMSIQSILAHAAGAKGILNFEANIAPRLTASVWQALLDGDSDRALSRFGVFVQLNLLCARFGTRASSKKRAHLGAQRWSPPPATPPLEASESADLAAGLARLELHKYEEF